MSEVNTRSAVNLFAIQTISNVKSELALLEALLNGEEVISAAVEETPAKRASVKKTPKADTPNATVEDVQRVLTDIAKASPEGKDHVLGVLASFGANRVKDIKPADFASVIEEAQKQPEPV